MTEPSRKLTKPCKICEYFRLQNFQCHRNARCKLNGMFNL